MTDEDTKDEQEPVGGERLRLARRANDISVRDVAKELHLDEQKVRALEKNDFDQLGAPVFAKGHLRKYAEMVGVDVDDIMTEYYQMNRSAGAPPVVGPKRKMPTDFDPTPWAIGALIVGLLSVLLWWWLGSRGEEAVADAAAPVQVAPFVAEPSTASDPVPEPDLAIEDAVDTTPDVAGEPDIAPVADSAADARPDPEQTDYEPTDGVAQVAVTLEFIGDCWTEVSDANGRRLFYDLGRSGRTLTLTGDAPLRVILGDADNVSISVAGEPWPVPASARRGRLARLSIDAP